MNDEQGSVDELGKGDGTVRGLALGDRRPCNRVVLCLYAIGREQPPSNPANQFVRFGVYHHHRAVRAAEGEDVEHLVVLEL